MVFNLNFKIYLNSISRFKNFDFIKVLYYFIESLKVFINYWICYSFIIINLFDLDISFTITIANYLILKITKGY